MTSTRDTHFCEPRPRKVVHACSATRHRVIGAVHTALCQSPGRHHGKVERPSHWLTQFTASWTAAVNDRVVGQNRRSLVTHCASAIRSIQAVYRPSYVEE